MRALVARNDRVSLTIPADLRDRLRDLARQSGLPMTQVIRIMVLRLEREGPL